MGKKHNKNVTPEIISHSDSDIMQFVLTQLPPFTPFLTQGSVKYNNNNFIRLLSKFAAAFSHISVLRDKMFKTKHANISGILI